VLGLSQERKEGRKKKHDEMTQADDISHVEEDVFPSQSDKSKEHKRDKRSKSTKGMSALDLLLMSGKEDTKEKRSSSRAPAKSSVRSNATGFAHGSGKPVDPTIPSRFFLHRPFDLTN